MRRNLVLIAIVALVIAALLVWKLRGSASTAPAEPQVGSGDRAGTGTVGSARGPTPRAPGARPDTVDGDDRGNLAADGSREYITDTGRRVRDHSSSDGTPPLFPAPLPPEARTMSSQLVAEVAHKLKPMVAECGRDVTPADRGDRPTIMVTVTLDVADGTLTATEVDVAPIDVKGEIADKVAACVRERAAGLTVPSGDEANRTDYVAHFPIALR